MTTSRKNDIAKKALMVGSAVVTLTGAAALHNANAATATGNATAIILAPLSVTEQNALHFGSASVAAGTAGTITIDTAGARTAGGAGGVTLITGASNENQGVLRINAPPTTIPITVSVTAAAAVTHTTAPVNTMAVGTFTLLGGGVGPAATITFTLTAADTQEDINVGATLAVAAAQVPGTYQGTYTVNISY